MVKAYPFSAVSTTILMRLLLLLAVAVDVEGHGRLIEPPSRFVDDFEGQNLSSFVITLFSHLLSLYEFLLELISGVVRPIFFCNAICSVLGSTLINSDNL